MSPAAWQKSKLSAHILKFKKHRLYATRNS